MKNKKITGLVALVLILVVIGAVNSIFSALALRQDLTAEKLYTLSAGSRAALTNVTRQVVVKYFFSESAKDMPASLKVYATQVKDLLREYERAAAGRLTLEFYDPKTDSDEEDWAVKYGIEPQQINPFGSPIYFGLVATCEGREEVIAGFSPRTEPTLEYDLTRAILRAALPERPVVGILSGIPGVLGQEGNPMMQQRPQPGWVAFAELKKDYTVREIAATAETIDADVKTLILLHPKNISDKTLFAIDQFVVKGGRVIACVDPFSFMDFQASARQQNPMMGAMGPQAGPSTLGKLFEAWGVKFDPLKCVADEGAAVRMRGRTGTVESDPTVLELGQANVLRGDVLTAGVTQMMFPYAGALDCTPPKGLTAVPVILSSTNSCLVDASLLQAGPEAIRAQVKPDGLARTIAVRLEGTFPTAFPKGPDPSSTNAAPQVVAKGESSVFVFGDADFLADPVCVQVVNTLFGQTAQLRGDNLSFFMNAVEQLAGRKELIGLRSRGPSDRPFEKVRLLQTEAEKKFRTEAEKYQARAEAAQKELNDLLQSRKGNDRVLLSKELEAKITQLRAERKETAKALKNVRKNMNADIERLGFQVKMINICLVPFLIILFGIGRVALRRK